MPQARNRLSITQQKAETRQAERGTPVQSQELSILGQDFHDIDHSNGSGPTGGPEYSLSTTDLEILQLHKAFELPDYPERQSLIDVFFDKCWAFMPVVDRLGLDPTDNENPTSYVLLQAVLLAGRIMRPNRYPASIIDVVYRRLKALIYSGYERDPLNLLAALCVVQWVPAAAPKDVTQDSPRYWTTMAVGIAQQMGLHRKSASPKADESLRRRIWFTLCARDNVSASAHGRPRLINLLDCDQPILTIEDFPKSTNSKHAQIFLSYVSVLQILGDLCQCVVRKGEAAAHEKEDIAARLMAFTSNLPPDLRLVDGTGSPMPYDLLVAQLHIPILATILILYRPRSVFTLKSASAAGVAAANLSYRIFEAIELREHTHCLSSTFAWHLLMTCVPLVSSLKVPQLREAADSALDSLERSLETLGKTRPAGANNLRSVRSIRKAMASSLESGRVGSLEGDLQDSGTYLSMAPALLSIYGGEAVRHYEKLVGQLGPPVPNNLNDGTETNYDLTLPSQHQQDFLELLGIGDAEDQFNFDDLFGLGHSWMMRDWVTEF
ncbi:hypothetical protein PRZ48_014326 [Zasmidium cellare]|uniref:Xylanolytic transcriptional activator regulatory domain-containing protein n=1 Tax=Zasmidium cellare TaxID=395010 RepID=A0ABR0E0M4_ZASCE|nr:hypothetical protein PRZ48_014326 [Zasmidium cellare]